jgi:hypothetical protein
VPTNRIVTEAEYDRWKKERSNWGRWGKDDQLGAESHHAGEAQAGGRPGEGRFFRLAGRRRRHGLLYLGVHLFDNCDLEALGEAAAARKRWSSC